MACDEFATLRKGLAHGPPQSVPTKKARRPRSPVHLYASRENYSNVSRRSRRLCRGDPSSVCRSPRRRSDPCRLSLPSVAELHQLVGPSRRAPPGHKLPPTIPLPGDSPDGSSRRSGLVRFGTPYVWGCDRWGRTLWSFTTPSSGNLHTGLSCPRCQGLDGLVARSVSSFPELSGPTEGGSFSGPALQPPDGSPTPPTLPGHVDTPDPQTPSPSADR